MGRWWRRCCGLRHNSLIRLNLDGFLLNLPQLRGTEAVDSLDLSNGSLSAIAIAFLVERNTALTNLNLLKNCFVTEAATQLGGSNPPATQDAQNPLRLQARPDGCQLGQPARQYHRQYTKAPVYLQPADGILIAADLGVNEVLITLNLSGNSLGPVGGAAIAAALRINSVVKHVDASNSGYTAKEMREAGYTRDEAMAMTGISDRAAEAAGYGTFADAKQAGFSLTEMRQAGFRCGDAKQAGFSLTEMRRAGFRCGDARQAGYLPMECQEAGFTHQEAIEASYGFDESTWSGRNRRSPSNQEWLRGEASRMRNEGSSCADLRQARLLAN